MAGGTCPECGYSVESGAKYCEDCGALLESFGNMTAGNILAPRDGDLIGDRFEITKVLSVHPGSHTFLALDRENDNLHVWVKRKLLSGDDEDSFKSLVESMLILKDNEHENIARILDVYMTSDSGYLVCEQLKGENLDLILNLKRDEIDERLILPIAAQVATAIGFLHSLGLLHMDIQPSHLFLTESGILKVTGFDRLCSAENPGRTNEVTEGFSPPEFYGLMGGKPGYYSDIFSLGAVLFHILTGIKLREFSREKIFNFTLMIENEKKLSRGMKDLLIKATSKDPEKRYGNADEVLNALSLVRSGMDTTENEVSSAEPVHDEPEREMAVETSIMTHIGTVKDINQDSSIVCTLKAFEKSVPIDFNLMVVADGMGGEAEGEKASSLAIRVIGTELMERFLPYMAGSDTTKLYSEGKTGEMAMDILKSSLQRANRFVYDFSLEDPARRGMGSTITAGIVVRDNLCICHAGDTRAYLIRNGVLNQLTDDHSFVGRLVRMGQITREEARKSPQKSAVYRALGTSEMLEIDTVHQKIEPGDFIIICCDGLWENFTDDEILETVERLRSPGAVARELLDKSIEREADDNVTIITALVSNGEGADPSSEKSAELDYEQIELDY